MNEIFISVDIESSGPIPGRYSMLSLGACVVGHRPAITYYAELQPISEHHVEAAMRVVGRPLTSFLADGRRPDDVMTEFGKWVESVSADASPVFVGFNAAYDWSFVNWYFHTYLEQNPFGMSALDIKSFYMGMAATSWDATKSSAIPSNLKGTEPHTHNALDDAIEQASMFERMLLASRGRQA